MSHGSEWQSQSIAALESAEATEQEEHAEIAEDEGSNFTFIRDVFTKSAGIGQKQECFESLVTCSHPGKHNERHGCWPRKKDCYS